MRELIDSIQQNGVIYTLRRIFAYPINSIILPKIWPIIHYPARILMNHSESEYENAIDRKCVGILGRGPSLKNVHELEFVDTFIIVNEFEMEDETVRSALSGKDIIHFVKISEPTLSFWYYHTFNFVSYQLRIMECDDKAYPWKDQRWGKKKPELYGFKPRYLPESIDTVLKEHFPEGPNTNGIFAILYAAEASTAKNIYTAGIDFLQPGLAGYLSSEDPSEEKIKERESRSQDLMEDMTQIAKIYPEKEFHIITQSTYAPDIENVHTYQRGVEPKE